MGTGSEAVSAVANSVRDVDGVKKKWADLKSAVKKKEQRDQGSKKMTLVDHRLLFWMHLKRRFCQSSEIQR